MRVTRRFHALRTGAGIALIWLACAGPALAAVCPSESGRYRVVVPIEMPPVRIHHNYSRSQLGLIAFHGPTNRVLGVTASKLRAGTATYYGNRPLEGEGVCFWVDHVEVTLRYEALDIYIASEYSRGSCQYQAILTHEKRHADVARTHLDDYVQTIRSVLSSLAIPKPRDPRLVESVTEAQQKTQATIEKLLKPVVARLRQDMDAAQKRIDSRAEYRRVETQCPKW
jgi:hypothetical protein